MTAKHRLAPGAEEDVLEGLVARARVGDATALDDLVRTVATPLHNLALRMLWHPQDAEDAVQEILVKVVTGIGSFRGDAAVTTWVYRIGVNHLLTARRRRFENMELSFEAHAEDLGVGLDTPLPLGLHVEDGVLEQEVKVGCTHAMLMCLDRDARMAFILGDVFDMPSVDAATLCDVSPATFRKRLSRARAAIRAHMTHHCGLVNQAVACRCRRRIGVAIERQRVVPTELHFAGPDVEVVDRGVVEMEQLNTAAAIFHSTPLYRPPKRLAAGVNRLLTSRRWTVLDDHAEGGNSGN